MRIMLTIVPALAHLYPIVPMAWALQCAGHEVCVASHPDMADPITAAGLTAVSLGETVDLTKSVQTVAGNEMLERITDALELDPADSNLWTAIRYYLLEQFSSCYPFESPPAGSRPIVDDLVGFARSWRPDLVLWDPLFFPAPIAARACGAAHARFLWGLDQFAWTRARFVERLNQSRGELQEDLMAELMRPTLRRFGIEFDEELLVGQWTIDPMPSRLRLPLDLPLVPVRWVPYNGAAAIPEWLYKRPGRPRICLTLGVSIRKFFALESKFPIVELLETVAGLDVELVLTWSTSQLSSLGSVPDNVRTIDYVPLNLLLPTCSAVIHHGGAGTFAAAVTHRVPQFLITGEGGDFLDIAKYVVTRGAGLAIEGKHFTVDTFKKKLIQILEESSFQDGAAALYADLLATPSPHDIVAVLEKLTAQHCN